MRRNNKIQKKKKRNSGQKFVISPPHFHYPAKLMAFNHLIEAN